MMSTRLFEKETSGADIFLLLSSSQIGKKCYRFKCLVHRGLYIRIIEVFEVIIRRI